MRKKSLIQFVAVTLIAVVFTVLVKIVDVGFVSSTGSLVGFSYRENTHNLLHCFSHIHSCKFRNAETFVPHRHEA